MGGKGLRKGGGGTTKWNKETRVKKVIHLTANIGRKNRTNNG